MQEWFFGVLAQTIVLLSGIVGYAIRTERRLATIEAKLEMLLHDKRR
jgi:hypothetical protein